jgi:hypothetical protein
MCEDIANDGSQFYKLRHLIAGLNDVQQFHAQQYFTLVNTNNPLASVAAENLIKLFTPDEVALEEVSKMMVIFNGVKKDMTESGGATAQLRAHQIFKLAAIQMTYDKLRLHRLQRIVSCNL